MNAFNDYQQQARKFAIYKEPLYPVFALSEETGELHKIYAKKARGDEAYQDEDNNRRLIKGELGDIMWMIANIATDNNLTVQEIVDYNIEKLNSRMHRNMIKGDGDER